MKIKDIKVNICSPTRNFVTVKVITDEGIFGLGDATVNGRELSVVSYLEDHLKPFLIGKDASKIEYIWQYLYRGAYWRRGPITMAAASAIDMALWDIKAKKANMPLYELLGGKARDKMLVYGHANGADLDDTLEQFSKYVDKGYRAIRVQCGVPGLDDTYGVAQGESAKGYYEPAKGDLPEECTWDTHKYLNFIPKVFEKIRAEFGYEKHLLHDSHHRLRPIEAAQLGKMLEPYRLFWLEDTVPAELQEGFEIIRKHTTTPLAVGEIFNTIYDCQYLLTNQLIDYIRTTSTHAGGITGLRKIAALADPFHVKTGCHGPTDISPIGMAACFHFGLSVNNFGIQEFMRHEDQIEEVFPNSYHFDDGYVTLDETKVGLGVEFNEDLAEKYAYDRKYLPVNQLEDGSMWNW